MSIIEKMPNWLKYILAIPLGLLCVFVIGMIIYFSNRLFFSEDSLWVKIVQFLYRNGGNVIVFFYTLNSILPKHKFKITLGIAIIFGLFCSIIEGMAFITIGTTIEYIIAYVEIIVCLIISCYMSFNNKFD